MSQGKTGINVNAEKIDNLLTGAGISYAKAGELCELSGSWWTNIKNRGTASPDMIKKLAMLLRVKPEELILIEAKEQQMETSVLDIRRLSEKFDLLHGENLEIKQKLESMPEMIAAALARYQTAEAWLFSKLKHNRDGISETQLKQLAQNNGISTEELKIAMETIGVDRYKKNGNTWLSLYRTV